ncbi:hypothetical protein [Novipirellula rosea]|uniref:hypothetical protein n=1 Tax=Novipirellula rosea TaxID=1031540 RepID=UPI0031E58D83
MANQPAVPGDGGHYPNGDDDMMAVLAAFQTVIMRDRTCVRFPAFLVESSVPC